VALLAAKLGAASGDADGRNHPRRGGAAGSARRNVMRRKAFVTWNSNGSAFLARDIGIGVVTDLVLHGYPRSWWTSPTNILTRAQAAILNNVPMRSLAVEDVATDNER